MILDEIKARLRTIRDRQIAKLATDPQKRAAWKVLHGPVDWRRYEPGGARGCGRSRLTRAAIYMIRQCTPRPLRAFSA